MLFHTLTITSGGSGAGSPTGVTPGPSRAAGPGSRSAWCNRRVGANCSRNPKPPPRAAFPAALQMDGLAAMGARGKAQPACGVPAATRPIKGAADTGRKKTQQVSTTQHTQRKHWKSDPVPQQLELQPEDSEPTFAGAVQAPGSDGLRLALTSLLVPGNKARVTAGPGLFKFFPCPVSTTPPATHPPPPPTGTAPPRKVTSVATTACMGKTIH